MATLRLQVVPVLQDNYSYILDDGKGAFVVDPPESAPLVSVLRSGGLVVRGILLTHRHGDHVAGVVSLLREADVVDGVVVYGPGEDGEIEGVTARVVGGDSIDVLGVEAGVVAVPGHTRGHIAYDLAAESLLFCGDCLFSLGCGRVFEGTFEHMWQSIVRLRALGDDRRLCCGHEYTLVNGAFALRHDGGNGALRGWVQEAETLRGRGLPTVPVVMGDERLRNPFLRADDVALQRVLGMEGASAVEVFTFLRQARDRW
ncbi:MAG: hydroxyacylglutathione hydrolase [Alphaproteobacteria bacterium GM202ARS2]|nr:hydroxyacylglutathione hydrolase [Alphaproteobacteria bacterium GM202ARS2]